MSDASKSINVNLDKYVRYKLAMGRIKLYIRNIRFWFKILVIGTVCVLPSTAFTQALSDVQRLDKQAYELYQQGRYADAVPLLKRELAINEKALGQNNPNVAGSLNNLGNLYLRLGRYADAEPLYKQSLEIREKALGPNHPDVAASLFTLATLYFHEDRYADAELLFERSLKIREKALGPDHPEVAASLASLASLLDHQGRYTVAEPLYKRSLAIAEKAFGPNNQKVAEYLDALAGNYRVQGRYAAAEPLYKRSQAIIEAALGPDHPDVAVYLNNLANLYTDQERYTDAEPLYKRAIEIQEKALGPDHPAVAGSLNNLATVYESMGRDTDAERLDRRSLAIYEKALGPDHSDVAEALDNLANLYAGQSRFADAEPLYRRAIEIQEKALGPDHPTVAGSLNNLATVYESMARYADAERLDRRSLAIYEKALGPDKIEVAAPLLGLANVYADQDRYADTEQLIRRSVDIYEKALSPEHPSVADALNNLADTYIHLGRYADAERLEKRSLAIYEKALGPDHPKVANSLNNLARIYSRQSRYNDALPLVRRTIQGRAARPDIAFEVLSGAGREQLITPEQAFSDGYNVMQLSVSTAAAQAVEKLALRFAAGSDHLAEIVRHDQDLSDEADKLDKAIITAAGKAPAERNPTAEDQLRKRLAEITLERGDILNVLGQKFPDYVALSKPQPLTLEETQKLLADNEAVVAFVIEYARSYVWVVTKTDGFWTEIPVDAKTLNEHVKTLRQSLTFNTDKPFDAALAYKIYQETFAPIADKLAGKKRLSILADGALTSVPMGVLVASDPAGKSLKDIDWLVNHYATTSLPSIFSLKTMRAQAAASSAAKPMIAFADPVFSKQAHAEAAALSASRSLPTFYHGIQVDVAALGESLPQLPGTRSEVEKVAKEIGAAPGDLKFGLDATVTAVERAPLNQYRIVYFATHGLVAGDLKTFAKAKAEPSLVLSIPDTPTEQDNGLLPASDIATLKLNADWAVLSACNTAAGDEVGAEALSGLARAFLYAGARSLVVSNWDVSDDGTAELMSKLFDISSKHPELSHSEALQQAELAMIAQAKDDDELHPRYWAPFVVVGEPLSQSPGSAAIQPALARAGQNKNSADAPAADKPAAVPSPVVGQVIAHLGPDDITQEELDNELRLANVPADKRTDDVVKANLGRIVERIYLAQEAIAAKIDRDPTVHLELIKSSEQNLTGAYAPLIVLRSREQILANAYVKHELDSKVAAILKSEIDSYIQRHPAQFARRQIFNIEQVSFQPTNDMEALAAATRDVSSIDQVVAKLNRLGIKNSRGSGALDGATLGEQPLKELQTRGPDNVFFIGSKTSTAVYFKVRSVDDKPLTGDGAQQLGKRQLALELANRAAEDTSKAALAAAKFAGDYARIMTTAAPTVPAAGEAAPGETPGAAKLDEEQQKEAPKN